MNVWPRLLKLVWPQRRLWFATLFLAFGSLACAVGLMGTAAWLISQAALQPSISELGLAIVGVRFFGLARGLVRYAERYLGHDLAFRLAGQLRCWLYQRLEPLAPARLSKMASGDLLSRVVADVEKVEEFFISALTPPAVALLTAGLLGGLLLALGDGLALPALVGLALGAALTWWAARLRSAPTGRAVAELRGRLAKVAMDGLQGAREIVAAGAQQRHGAKLAEIDDALGAARRRLTSRAALGQAVASMTGHWTLVAVLLVAIPAVRAGTLDRVLLPVVALLVLSAFEAVGPLVPAWRSAIEGAASGRRLFEILDAKPAVQAGGKPWRSGDTATSEVRRAPALRITDLHFAYAPGAPPVLRGVDVDLPAGQTLLITGASGGGKTTLLNLLLRFWDYSEGSIRLDGDELSTLDAESVRRRIGLISQDAHVFTGTLMGNLRLAAPEASPQDIAEAVRRARLDDLVERLPSGCGTWLGEHGVNLSGGERQRVAIARALLQDVPWVLLDEPTAHLDPTTAEQVARELDTALRGTTRVVVSHRPDVWWHRADRILQLRDGRGRDEPCRPRTTAAAD